DHVVVLAVGHQGRGGGRGDHDHAFVVVDGRCGDRGTGAHVAHDVVDLFIDDAVGHDRTWLGLATVIDHDGFELVAQHATTSIDGFDCRVHAFLDHVAVLRQCPGEGPRDGDADGIGMRHGRKHHAGGQAQCGCHRRKAYVHKT